MKVFLTYLVLAVVVGVTSAWIFKTKVEIAFIKDGLTKYVKVPPKRLTTAEFKGNVFVNLGNELTPAQVAEVPRKTFPGDKNTNYTIIFVDVNYSKNPKIQYLHGLIVNIRGGDAQNGQIASDYIPPQPAKGTGYHYYVTLAYEQHVVMNLEEVKTFPGIIHPDTFSLDDFKAKYCLGNPYSGNFFKSKYQYLADAELH